MDTYFLVKIWVDNELTVYGPYLELDDAVTMLIDHLPPIALAQILKKKVARYLAEVHECILNADGSWDTIAIRIKENECERRPHM